ncbi:hypothetical protein AMECASPLE_011107, partial [Ameca splendens]
MQRHSKLSNKLAFRLVVIKSGLPLSVGVMEGSTCRLTAAPEGEPRPSGSRQSGRDAGSEPTRDMRTHFRVCRFIMESGVKLGMRSVPVATACVLYHRFFQRVTPGVYEPYLVAMSCLYLAGKVEEQHIRTRDIINVSHSTLPISDTLQLCLEEIKSWINNKFLQLKSSRIEGIFICTPHQLHLSLIITITFIWTSDSPLLSPAL